MNLAELIERNIILKNGRITPQIKRNLSEEDLISLYESTKFLSLDSALRERIYVLRFGITTEPKCYCGKKAVFKGGARGYARYCSNSCANKSESTKEKYKQTCLRKFGVDNASKSKEIKAKKENTVIENYGSYQNKIDETFSKPRKLGKYRENTRIRKVYYNSIKFFTEANKKYLSQYGLLKIGPHGVEGAFQLDHKYSCAEGYKNNIHPAIIGSKHNLEYLPWEENQRKSANCSIELGTILSLIEMDSIKCDLLQFKQLLGI